MARRGVGNVSGSLGRPLAGRGIGGRSSGDRVDRGTPFKGSVHPRKGKGWGQQGEAAYPDLLSHWDRLSGWRSWRLGMGLARSQLAGAAERWSGIDVLRRDGFTRQQGWRRVPLLLAGITSRQSPEGRWTVAVQPRGTLTAYHPTPAEQSEFWYSYPDQPERAPLRLLQLDYANAPLPSENDPGLHLNRMLIGEVLEDSALSPSSLAEDPTDGIGMLCVAVNEERRLAYFDATRIWRRERTSDGRLVLREVAVSSDEPLPRFRSDRHLTQAMTVSCNCPSHLGLEYGRLLGGGRLGAQALFPQRSPSGLSGLGDADDATLAGIAGEGVSRQFAPLPWDRIPGRECKHCHAVRWTMGCPMAEPTDMLSPDSDYWRDLAVMERVEEGQSAMSQPRFLDRLRANLLDEQAFSMLDVPLLAACAGDAVGVVPQRVPLFSDQVAAAAESQLGLSGLETAFAASGVLDPLAVFELDVFVYGVFGLTEARINEQRQVLRPEDDEAAIFGDWWVGRSTSQLVLGLNGPGQTESSGPALQPLAIDAELPRVLP